MARTKSSRPASKSASKSSSTSSSTKKSARGAQASRSSASSDDLTQTSFARARDFVETNVDLQTAGIALAGAGILALVSTQAGRSLVKTATTTIVGLVSQNFGSYFGAEQDEDSTEERQKPSRQRDQARI